MLATRRVVRPTQLFLIGATIAFAVLEIAVGSMPGFDTTAIMLVPTGLIMLTFTTAANSSVQLGVEPTMRGRVMALYMMCFMGGTPFGAPTIGWVAETFGPRWGLLGGGMICLIAALAIAVVIARVRDLRPAGIAERLGHAW